MTVLAIYPDTDPISPEVLRDREAIAARLQAIGVALERWAADRPLAADAGQEEVLQAYAADVERLNARYGFKSVDVVALRPDNPKKAELRERFLAEHTHDDFEIRFFVGGRGLFYLHVNEKVYALLCADGDLVAVPANTTHWFDMGRDPDFKCIRLFTDPAGWVGKFTGDDIAHHFPDFDHFVEAYMA